MSGLQPFQLLIKPVGPDCNLRCTYCFYYRVTRLFPQKLHWMNKNVLEAMIKQYLSYQFPTSVFSWQGGEPTLAGISFFRQVVELQIKYGKNKQAVGNSLQTNGILIDAEWCKFLKEYSFFVGLSLDGPQYIHDHYRKGIKGSSWEKVVNAADLLRQYNVEFNVLTVINRMNQTKGKEIVEWFIKNGFSFLQFIPCLEVDVDGKLTPESVTPDGYGQFLCDTFDVWYDNRGKNISIRDFDSFIELLVCGRVTLCVYSDYCHGYMLVEHDGSVYPCDFFVYENTKLGNLLETPLAKLFQSIEYEMFGRKKTKLGDDCQNCQWYKYCYGGCQKDRVDSSGKPNIKTYLCQSYKKFFHYATPRLQKYADEIRQNMQRQQQQNV